MTATVFIGFAAGILLTPLAMGQPKPQVVYGPMGEIGSANLPGAKIGPNDLLAVSVYDAPELTRTVRVTNEGFIRLPMLKKPLRALGLVPNEMELQIASALRDEGILVDPIVAVTVAEYHSRPISVVGSVRKPVTFQAAGPLTLLEAIGRAEGLTDDAGPEILVSRPDVNNPATKQLVARIDIRELIDKARPELNLALTGGEEIRVPEARKVYVAGNVKKPGPIPVREGSPVTVMKALAISEGLTPYYRKTIYILRPNGDAPRQEIPVELSKLLDRKTQDVPLMPDDILYIPDNNAKRVAVNILDKATVFSLSTVSGVLIWRR